MIVVQGELRVHPDDVAAVRDLALPFIAANRAEAGNIAYAFAEDLHEPGLIRISERWADEPSLQAHGTMPHYLAFAGALAKLRVMGLRVTGYEAAEERVLLG